MYNHKTVKRFTIYINFYNKGRHFLNCVQKVSSTLFFSFRKKNISI